MIPLQKLPPKAIEILQYRLADEQELFYFYISAAAWCRLNGYECASKYFIVESHGEEYHYKRLSTFLMDWHTEVAYPVLQDPIKTFSGLKEILEMAYELEYGLYRRYETNAIEIFPVCQNTHNLMTDFVNVQNDAVICAGRILNKLKNYLEVDPTLVQFDKDAFGEYSSVYY